MASFTDQKFRRATEHDLKANWSGGKNGIFFKCHLCGYKFQLNDYWRWVYNNKGGANILVCEKCDCVDVIDKYNDLYKEFKSEKFWSFRRFYS